mmetsp:Transcript_4111/g.5770  ORF Transcript_4111/g.5770 Transcript_4111/m.5770 type:complete len:204 (+) Transcript_4111:37-648(+)|eukprot:CAMPEP_0197291834 /NCGR_PEP_ID=MMETSP0890-20130614/19391_1 /TAXON_ID=44058 ORGANISM="Aureoumbra lagunensis, Strain CCMP1510" /NCGR_SAMPLE_ID=MMETSP0890 /ASSEMBLY_ACC=CAM_ASM_000533 /LENGTH=203 /DNA_ID=CAMNT_0042765257 /DNA_START=22 /DNA_END=633 /DNA_ORIENTATION=-
MDGILAGLRFAGDYKKTRVGLEVSEKYQNRCSENLGDGGRSFRIAALKRCIGQAQKSEKSLDAVVTERYGSLEALTQGDPDVLEQAKNYQHKHPPKRRRRVIQEDEEEDDSLEKTSGDAAMLREYAVELEAAIHKAATNGRARKKKDQQHSSASSRGSGWVGLESRTSLGLGSSFQNDSSWRHQDRLLPSHTLPDDSAESRIK